MPSIKTIAALAAGVLGAAAAMAAATPITSDQFAPGWQAHAQGLINRGASALDLSKTRWYVPANTPPGEYVLVERRGDTAEVIDGYRFKVTRGDVAREINMIVPQSYGNVEAVPLADVPALAARREPAGSR